MVDEGVGGVSVCCVCEIKAFDFALGDAAEARTYWPSGGSKCQCFQGCNRHVDPGSLALRV